MSRRCYNAKNQPIQMYISYAPKLYGKRIKGHYKKNYYSLDSYGDNVKNCH